MIGDRTKEVVYVALPALLWPLSFDVLKSHFVYAMAASTLLLGALTLAWFPNRVRWFRASRAVAVLLGVVFAFVMYAVFLGGYAFLALLHLSSYVDVVYATVGGTTGGYTLPVALVLIGLMEEIYWRGGLQELARRLLSGEPWVLSTTYYTLVHVSTFNPALVAGALVVGLIDGLLADKVGLAAAAITHILWLELIMVALPL